MSFSDDVLAFTLKARERTKRKFKKVVLDLDRRIIYRTPVDTGAACGNWQASIGAPQADTDPARVDPNGDETVGTAEGIIDKLQLGDTAWLSNGLPYIRVLEYGLFPNPPKAGTGRTESGFSTQAIGGMVSVSAAEFGDIIDEATE